MRKILILLIQLLCLSSLSSCINKMSPKKTYSDSIVVGYYQGVFGGCNMHFKEWYPDFSESKITDTVELSKELFFFLKNNLKGKKMKDLKYACDAKVFVKYDNTAICFSEIPRAFNDKEEVIDIDLYVIHLIMQRSKYYNYLIFDDLQYLKTIQTYGLPDDYEFTKKDVKYEDNVVRVYRIMNKVMFVPKQ